MTVNIEALDGVQKTPRLGIKERSWQRDKMSQETGARETCTNAKAILEVASNGVLVPLKTTLETRARDAFLDVYITNVPVKQASGTLE
jgi:hypothetical protein